MRRRKRPTVTVVADAAVTPVNATCTAKDPDLEVSDLIVAVAVLLGEAAARSRTHMRRIDARPLRSVNAIIVSRPWLRAFCPTVIAACRLLRVGRGTVKGTETAIVSASASVTANATMTVIAPGATMTATITASGGTEKRSVSDSTAGAWDLMTSSHMGMSARLDPDADVRRMRMTAGIPGTQRYGAFLNYDHV